MEDKPFLLLELTGVGDTTHHLSIGSYYLQYMDNPALAQT